MPEQPGSAGTESRPIDLVAAALVLNQTVDELPGNIASASIGENGDIRFLSEFDDFSNDELITQLSGSQETLIGGHAVVSGSQKDLTRWHIGNGYMVSIDGTNSPVAEGETLNVDATITNVGGTSQTKTVTLDGDGAQRDSQSVSLSGNSQTQITLSWATQAGDAGDVTLSVSSPDDTDQTTATIWESSGLIYNYDDTGKESVASGWSGWTGDTDEIDLANKTIDGSTAEIAGTSSVSRTINATRDTIDGSITEYWHVQVAKIAVDWFDDPNYTQVTYYGDNSGSISIRFDKENNININGTTVAQHTAEVQTDGDWSKIRTFRLSFDFGAETATVFMDGENLGSFTLGSGNSGIGKISCTVTEHDSEPADQVILAFDNFYEGAF